MENSKPSEKKSSHVQSVERALLLIELLAKEDSEMTLTEIATRLNWPKSTVYGLISTLRDYRYVDQSEETGCYRLGIRFFELGNQIGHSWDIRSIAKPFMQKLNNQLGDMIQLATEDQGEVLYLDKIDSHHLIRIVSEIGRRLPMHCSGLGKSILAYLPEGKVKQIIRQHGMHSFTERTITTLPALLKELEKIRSQGYAVDDQEVMMGLRCVAAPIFDSRGQVKYAVSVSGLCSEMSGERMERVIVLVKETADSISSAMGYRKPRQN